MPSVIKRLVNFAERTIGSVVFMVGLYTIMDYADRNYPKTWVTISTVFLLGTLIWFIVRYLAIPFVEGMRGTKTTEKTDRDRDAPRGAPLPHD